MTEEELDTLIERKLGRMLEEVSQYDPTVTLEVHVARVIARLRSIPDDPEPTE